MEPSAALDAWVNQMVMLELLGEPSVTEPGLPAPLGAGPAGRLKEVSGLGIMLEQDIGEGEVFVERFYPWTAIRSVERVPGETTPPG